MSTRLNRMKKRVPYLMTRVLISLVFLTGMVSMSVACSRNIKDPSASSSESSGTIPTGPDLVFERGIGVSELLKDLLDINWEDIESATLTKYKDDIEVSTVTIQDKEMITQIDKLFSKLSVIHVSPDIGSDPDINVIYEIVFQQKSTKSEAFLSVGPVYEDQTFAIGGSFISVQELNPRDPLVNTNQFVKFEDFEDLFETVLGEE